MHPDFEICDFSLCIPHSGEDTESDDTDVDECECERFENNIVSEHEWFSKYDEIN